MTWAMAARIPELTSGPVLFRRSPKQIAIFKADGAIYAIDNRCPHEGYPLVAGTVDSACVLTCNWHNWKFRLQDGTCVLGGDHVRSYPVELRGDEVWVDLADPPVEQVRARTMEGLRSAFEKRDYGRICRELARLELHGIGALAGVVAAAGWAAPRFEYGTTHAFAAAADWLAEAARYAPGSTERLVCQAEAVDHMAFDVLGEREHPFAAAGPPFDRGAFLAAVEREDLVTVEGMLMSAFGSGLGLAELEEPLTAAALAHYADFGHSLIYVYKAAQLVKWEPSHLLMPVVLSVGRNLVYATREDLLPEFAPYSATLARLAEKQGGGGADPGDPTHRSTEETCLWLVQAWTCLPPEEIYDRLLAANAWNFLHFDLANQAAWNVPVSRSSDWLDVTHGITFANAVRVQCTKYPHLWPQGLLQMACFAGRNQAICKENHGTGELAVTDEAALLAEIHQRLLDHGLRVPIFPAHLIKTARAVEEELPAAKSTTRRLLLSGLNRFFHSPLKQKHARRLAHQAMQLVRRDFADGD